MQGIAKKDKTTNCLPKVAHLQGFGLVVLEQFDTLACTGAFGRAAKASVCSAWTIV